MVLLVADIGDFKANPKRSATGTVLEAKLDRGRGPVATVLVQDGTLTVGDTVIAGTIVGKIRALMDDRGRPTKIAGPATPVEVLGLGGLPQPGDTFQAMADAAKARQIALFRQDQAKNDALGARGDALTLESLQAADRRRRHRRSCRSSSRPDVQGSAEVLADTLTKLSDEQRQDPHDPLGRRRHQRIGRAAGRGVERHHHRLQRAAGSQRRRRGRAREGRRPPALGHLSRDRRDQEGDDRPARADAQGSADRQRPRCAQTFKTPKFGTIAGCMVTDGHASRAAGDTQARLLRDNVVVHEGKLSSLRRFKDDVSEVKTGFECGIGFDELQRHQGRRRDRSVHGRAGGRHRVVSADAGRPAGSFIMSLVVGLLSIECYPARGAVAEGQARWCCGRRRIGLKKFNVSVAEVEHQAVWQRAGLAIVSVSNHRRAPGAAPSAAPDEIDRGSPDWSRAARSSGLTAAGPPDARLTASTRRRSDSRRAERAARPRGERSRIGLITITARQGERRSPGRARLLHRCWATRSRARRRPRRWTARLPFLRRQIASRAALRRAPELAFQYDESIARQERIEALLQQIHAEDKPADDEPDTAIEGRLIADASSTMDHAAAASARRRCSGTRFLITSHARPDGDSIGSQVAMAAGAARHRQDRAHASIATRRRQLTSVCPASEAIEVAERVDGDYDALLVHGMLAT